MTGHLVTAQQLNTDKTRLEVKDSVATVTLSRPDVRNAFDEEMIAAITAAFGLVDSDPEVRVVILAAAGKAFCAGADLSWMRRMAGFTLEENRRDALTLAMMLESVYRCKKPVIARVQGDCYAGGMGLIAACDFAVAVSSAEFCLSEVRLGLIPATIAPYVIPRMGPAAARRYMLTAERFPASDALRFGLIQRTVEADQLDSVVADWVKLLLANSSAAMAEAKRLLHDVTQSPLSAELVQDTAERIAMVRASVEGREGVTAFLEKRPPNWARLPQP
jgi:methylglutaconyl-CoA hydratase